MRQLAEIQDDHVIKTRLWLHRSRSCPARWPEDARQTSGKFFRVMPVVTVCRNGSCLFFGRPGLKHQAIHSRTAFSNHQTGNLPALEIHSAAAMGISFFPGHVIIAALHAVDRPHSFTSKTHLPGQCPAPNQPATQMSSLEDTIIDTWTDQIRHFFDSSAFRR